ncbi:unnamed protein product [Gongylonema pulchrum]|uniref:Protein kinase domain-containing protein n=1 Tax=Gongylonema pulchrum TaxID=637853 RepID=A0A183DA04_9BILA|nr:unnamed protein product [Gongylonema pulchrum]
MAVGSVPPLPPSQPPAPPAARADKDRLPKIGDALKSERQIFRLQKIIGEGGYGIVFESELENRWALLQRLFSVKNSSLR